MSTKPARPDSAALSSSAREGSFSYVLLGFADLQGLIRGKALRPEAYESACSKGTKITDLLLALDPTDSPIELYSDIGIRSGAADLNFRPDPETLRPLSWRPGWQICFGTPLLEDGSACLYSPRETLHRSLQQMSDIGYEVRAAFEYEIRLNDATDGRPISSGISYDVGEISRLSGLLDTLQPALEVMGVELGAVHTEAGPGLIELNVAPQEALAAADSATLLKFAVKEIAALHGLKANFMAKPVPEQEGSSGHVHISCWSRGQNAFARSGPEVGLVPAAKWALGGMLAHLPAASLMLNPTINSYKRLVPGWFAPVNASWGFENRSAALRAIIPLEHPDQCRIECRRPGADANPYLALAALVASAVGGLRRSLDPGDPVSGDAASRTDLPALPNSLEGALAAWRADSEFRDIIGPAFGEYYALSREWELQAWQQTVSSWETERYEMAV